MSGVVGTIPLLAQRAVLEDPRWTRAVGIIPPPLGERLIAKGLSRFTFHVFVLGLTAEMALE